jgi:hypothetical protein
MSPEVAKVPRTQMGVAAPLEGIYRIDATAAGSPGMLDVMAWGSGGVNGAQDRVFAETGARCSWEVTWRRRDDGKDFEVVLKRIAQKPDK